MITIKELSIDLESAGKIIDLIKKHEPKIWDVLKVELKQALNIHSVVVPKGTLPYDPKCDDACKFYCTKGNTQYPECLK